jgi:epoxyqueuosine reductase QueG
MSDGKVERPRACGQPSACSGQPENGALATDSLLAQLEAFLGSLGLALWGYAETGGLFGGEWEAWPRAISIAVELPAERLAGVQEGPTPAYFATYEEVNARLGELTQAIASWLHVAGYAARAFPVTVTAAELDTFPGHPLTAAVQHKTVATRAGLGWIGRSALLITRDYGPRVRLGTVFTTMPLPVATPVRASACGRCTRCVEACPAGAIHGAAWQEGLPRETLVDVQACRITAERLLLERVGAHNAVCGVCIAVCPYSGLREP